MKYSIAATGLLAIIALGGIGLSGVAYAQGTYLGNIGSQGETGKYTLEEALKLQSDRIQSVRDNPGQGSGTPYLDASGVLGGSVISAAIFGSIAGALFLRGRSGKYAAQGRG